MIADSSHVHTGQIRTEFVSFPSRAGLKIAACIDYRGPRLERRPWAIIAPKFGETKKNSLQLGYYLVANGLNVLRFDHIDHVGESEGDKTFFTLSGGATDILACGDYLARTHGAERLTLVANSLSARTAIRAASLDARIDHLVALVGVVNLRHTLHQVYRDDLVGGHIAGRRWGVGDMLGIEMDYDNFLRVAVQDNMHDLAGTREDLQRTAAALSFFPAEKDTWVSLADVDEALRGRANARLVPIAGAMHELRESAKVAEEAFRTIVAACTGHAYGVAPDSIAIKLPDTKELMRQNRLERERLRQLNKEQEGEREFWSKYLAKYRLLQKVEDYQSYLSLVGRLFGPIGPGEIVLDAGCGNGMFGLWVVRSLLEQNPKSDPPPLYVGLDLTLDGLRDAVETQAGYALSHARSQTSRATEYLGLLHGQTDLDTWGMPSSEVPGLVVFANGTFDKICCSLVLSYLTRPESVLAELHRVLRPGGRIVLSSMKPFCDMSEIYRDYMEQQVSETDLEAGRDLLRAAGKIRLKEEQGYYTFYSDDELGAMLAAAGFRNCSAHQSFGGQAVVVTAEK